MKKILKMSLLYCITTTLFLTSCRKFVEIDPPKTSLIKTTVFASDATATAAIISIYSSMYTLAAYSGGSQYSVSYLGALASDEFNYESTDPERIEFLNNNINPKSTILPSTWSAAYQQIYYVNTVLEGLVASSGLTPTLKTRLEGEAKFIRAFAYFYLVNLFGDVPLVLTTDYRINAVIPRTPKAEVYRQIIKDLEDAQKLLSTDYLTASGTATLERKRVNKFAPTAMLARVYLYLGNLGDNTAWSKAEEEATKIINYTTLYGPVPVKDMFLKNSKEAIWQLGLDVNNTSEAKLFLSRGNGVLRPLFVQQFESIDQRKINWINTTTVAGNIEYLAAKYKITATSPITEYSTVLRLGEQYLIRAEARAHQAGKVTGINSAESDINYIRNRAGIGNTSATNETTMLAAIEQERRFELFTEWGHRWLDLKRTNRANAVLGSLKGVDWQTTDQLWPIPEIQLQNDPAMVNQQNPGYN